ncbi:MULTISPECIES: type II toxin-antitoxin system HicA family toxin [unclassified Beijerinckia]|uniref:type II toxin-antitoxin system HicA family toxin n=1 Tax=unclassified Beijerinckia TaxID=2638183 RepID=UPI00089ABD09|nr:MULTISPECIES: type II toxin-antitoxin system HicA family toxin [unclassified Beijerinckia]SED15863.1 Predicted RNA binding protein YcfA, dsRBD-like fold, HicA-like mRNA interferase family [Beijerinckia sp. 28-YEA-48]
MDSREIIRRLTADGWVQVAQVGSHIQFKHPVKPGRCTVPHPKKDIPIGTLKSIEKQAGIRLR